MECDACDDQENLNENKDSFNDNNDSIVNLALAQRMRLKIKKNIEQSKNQDLRRTETSLCKRKTNLPKETALDALNTWISEQLEKENNSTGNSKKANDKVKTKLKNDSQAVSDCVNQYDEGCTTEEKKKKKKEKPKKPKDNHRTDKSCVVVDSRSPTFPKSKLVSKTEKKTKSNIDVSRQNRRHGSKDDSDQISVNPIDSQIDICDDEIHLPKKRVTNRILSDSDDSDIMEVTVEPPVTSVGNRRRRRSRENAPVSRSRPAKKTKTSKTQLPQTPGGTLGQAASPFTLGILKQLDDDERMARRLQEEFDAEEIANSLSAPQDLSMLPTFESRFDPPLLPTFDQHAAHRANNRHNQRYPMLQPDVWSPIYQDPMHPILQSYFNMVHTPRGRGRGRRRGRARNNRNQMMYHDELGEQDNGNNYESLMALAERLGPAIEKGLSALQISQLPTFVYTPDCKLQDKSCSICMGDYETGDNLRKLPCFHDYHDTCIDQWLAKNPVCPICRVEVQI